MKKYDTQPLDLMQFINTKYHDPFIHELIEFEDGLDTEKLIKAIEQLLMYFPFGNAIMIPQLTLFLKMSNFQVVTW